MSHDNRQTFPNARGYTAAFSLAIIVIAAASCGKSEGGGNAPPAFTSIQIIATPTNPKVGENTIISAIPVTDGGIHVSAATCKLSSGNSGLLKVTDNGSGNGTGLGLAPGNTFVQASCPPLANTLAITVRPSVVSLIVNKTGTGNGSVFVNPPGNTFDAGTTVVITATALTGSTFTGWSGACAGTNASCTLKLDNDQTVSASFVLGPPTKIISLSGSLGFGSVTVGQSASLAFTITNLGNSTLTVSGMTAPQGAFTGSWTSGAIAAGATQPVTINFTPPAAQSYSGTLTVNGDQTSGANTIPISATGVSGSSGGTARYDGTYDFTFRSPGPGGATVTNTTARYITITNGVIRSTDGAITSGSVNAAGAVSFTSVCPINSGSASWTGTMNTSAPAGSNTGSGGYTCSPAIGGSNNTWTMTQR